MAVFLDDALPLPPPHGDAEQLVRAAIRRVSGAQSPQAIVRSVGVSVPAPQFETGSDEDGVDYDFFITEEDSTEDTTKLTMP